MAIGSAALWISVTGLLCGVILTLAARFFAVHEDPKVEMVTGMLPGVNCGACGFAGCSEYAKIIVQEGASVSLCNPGGHDVAKKIADFMGVEAVVAARRVAVVLCQGGDDVAARHSHYNGIADCGGAELAGGGDKACRFGCHGLGSCARVCPVHAIELTGNRLAIVHPELCIACGKCVGACPRKLIKLVPETCSIHVLCSSKDKGPVVKKICSVGCIGCTLCAKAVNNIGIRMDGPLAVVDYATLLEKEDIMAKCPAQTIVKRPGTRSVERRGVV
jgi:electron transport complex protein RnfB